MRDEEIGPDTFFALDGSMKRGEIKTREKMNLGPKVPFVVKVLLDHPFIKAVIKEIRVAGNPTWMITYFSFPIADLDRPNLYGSDRYFVKTKAGELAYSSGLTEADYDYDLAKYIRLGKLFWIEKDDVNMTLQSSVEGCPYLNIKE